MGGGFYIYMEVTFSLLFYADRKHHPTHSSLHAGSCSVCAVPLQLHGPFGLK